MSASDCVYACRSRHGSLRPTRQARRQGQVVTRPQSPVQITALGIIALPHSQERHARQHHEPARALEKSIEPGHAPIPPAFSPTEFLRRLRSAENSYFVRLRSPLSTLPAGILSRRFRNVHHHRFLTTAACGGLRSTPDCRPRRAILHLSYSCASPFGPAILVTHDPHRTFFR